MRGAVHLIHEVLESTRPSEPDRIEKIQLKKFLEEIARLFSDRPRETGGPVRLGSVSQKLVVQSHRVNLSHILLGVLLHAFEVLKGPIQIDVTEQGDAVSICVSGKERSDEIPSERETPGRNADIEIARKLVAFEKGEIQAGTAASGAPYFTIRIHKLVPNFG